MANCIPMLLHSIVGFRLSKWEDLAESGKVGECFCLAEL